MGRNLHRTAQLSTLASFRTWGIQQELVAQALPERKSINNLDIANVFLQKIKYFLPTASQIPKNKLKIFLAN